MPDTPETPYYEVRCPFCGKIAMVYQAKFKICLPIIEKELSEVPDVFIAKPEICAECGAVWLKACALENPPRLVVVPGGKKGK